MRTRSGVPWAMVIAAAVLQLSTVSAAAYGVGPAQAGMPALERFLALLSNPNVAYLLLVAGLLALLTEISAPGASFPGVAGVILLILALIGLVRLPTNWVGVLLIISGVVMFLLDLKLGGFALSIGALVAFGLGSLLIFTPFWVTAPAGAAQLNPWLVVLTVFGVEAFFVLGLTRAMQAQRLPVAVGRETLVGQRAIVSKDLAPVGVVHVESEEWSAVSEDGDCLPAGAIVEVVGLEGLVLRVRPVEDEPVANGRDSDA